MAVEHMDPNVAIIILNWNGLEDTKECLESIKNLTYKNHIIVVVDNGSEGNDAEAILESYGDRIHLIRNDTNCGYAAGNNVGARYALANSDPDYLLLLNNDTVVDPGFLAELVALAEGDPDIGLVGPKTFYYDRPDVIQRIVNKADLMRGKIGLTGDNEPDCGKYDDVAQTDYVQGSCMLIKKRVIEKVGLLDESYFCYWEDLEYCLRAREAGFLSYYCPMAKIWHKGSRSAERVSGFNLYYGTRNRFFVLKKYATKGQYLSFLAFYFCIQFWRSAANHLLIRRSPRDFVYLVRGIRDGVLHSAASSMECLQGS